MAARGALEWIGTSKTQLVFRHEISDLFLVYCTTSDNHISGGGKLTFENDITGLTLTLWIL